MCIVAGAHILLVIFRPVALQIILIGTGIVLARLREKAAIPSQRYMAGTGPCSWFEPTMGLKLSL